ncbi:unnamed protein product [Orchesella dallaii]|uniref:Beta-lactamase-related domain-containing protein n=1 Tax=Orchesella dallaii TaxID=48710 RepID=A0ABP1QP33_9HEXA
MNRNLLTRYLSLLVLYWAAPFGKCELQNITDLEIQKKIEDFINNVYLPESKVTGFGLSIIQNNGEVVYGTGFGFADQEKGIPNGNQTQFLIASVTKSLTAAIVAKSLHEKFPELGEKVLDTPVRKLAPNYNFTLIDRFRSEYVTFRDMLAHRVCVENSDLTLIVESYDKSSDLAYRQRYATEQCGFRTKYNYNNQMYVVVGEIIEEITGVPYEELVNDFLIQAGMLNSSMASKDDDFSTMPHRAKPYYVKDNVSHPINTELVKRVVVYNAAGGLFATPIDMAKYMTLFLNSGKIGDNQVIPAEVMKWLIKPSIHIPLQFFKGKEDDNVIANYAYGLGLLISSYDSWQYINHDGYFTSYSSRMSLFPTLKLGIFSSSQSVSEVGILPLHMFITEILRGTENATEKVMKVIEHEKKFRNIVLTNNKQALQNFLGRNETTNIVESDEEIVGKYGSAIGGDLEVLEKFNEARNATALYVSYGKWSKGWLEQVGNTSTYKITWGTDIFQDFYALGDTSDSVVTISNGTFAFLQPQGGTMIPWTSFRLGVDISKLPTTSWDSDSCVSETKSKSKDE